LTVAQCDVAALFKVGRILKREREILALVPTFDAIYSELNLSRAAARMGVTQSAMSQSLARLRELFADELFLSNGRGLTPTPRASAVEPHVRTALSEIVKSTSAGVEDLSILGRQFAIDLGAGLEAFIGPALCHELLKSAPNMKIHIQQSQGVDPAAGLRTGEIALAVDFVPTQLPGVMSQVVASSRLVAIASSRGPLRIQGLGLAEYAAVKQVTLTWGRSFAGHGIEHEFSKVGRSIPAVMSVPTLDGLAAIVADSELISIVSEIAAKGLARRHDIAIHELPFEVGSVTLFQQWHSSAENDIAHKWLRTAVYSSFQSMAV